MNVLYQQPSSKKSNYLLDNPLLDFLNIVTYAPNYAGAISQLKNLIQEQPVDAGAVINPTLEQRIAESKDILEKYFPTTEAGLNALIESGEQPIFMPGVVRPNFRNPEQIKALRRLMAEEQRARGPIREIERPTWKRPEGLTPAEYLQLTKDKSLEELANYQNAPDPIDQILRGSWYHGMSSEARRKVNPFNDNIIDYAQSTLIHDILDNKSKSTLKDLWNHNKSLLNNVSVEMGYNDLGDYMINKLHKNNINVKNFDDVIPYLYDDIINSKKAKSLLRYYQSQPSAALNQTFNQGFPISRHDAASISNKLGEPAGVSLSLNPTVSGKFAADENIFRVMPLYGGPPTERTINLMTSEGRKALNDAYDVVANNWLIGQSDPWRLSTPAAIARDYLALPENVGMTGFMAQGGSHVGPFNEAMSRQLQNQGYRHILYNPKRWYEYEMLALDPQYALPLDYRPTREYIPGYGMHNLPKKYSNVYDKDYGVTPGARLKGLNQIEDVMAVNHSRLGDIYNERAWWDRLTPEVKEILLQDNREAERIIRQLKGEK